MFQQDSNLPRLHFSLASPIFREYAKPVIAVETEWPICRGIFLKTRLSEPMTESKFLKGNCPGAWWVSRPCSEEQTGSHRQAGEGPGHVWSFNVHKKLFKMQLLFQHIWGGGAVSQLFHPQQDPRDVGTSGPETTF